MKEIFDGLLVMLNEMKWAAIQSRTYYAARNYQRIQTKIIELQMKYNESLRKEPVAAKNTEMTALEYCLKGGIKMDAAKLGYVSECPYQNCEDFCKECWNEPLDEVK